MSDDTYDDNFDTVEGELADERVSPAAAIAVALVFAALTGWFLYQAIGNFVNVPAAYEAFEWADRIPWAVLYAGIALPVVFFVGAAVIARKQPLTHRVLVFAAALAATAASSFSLYAISLWLVTS